MQAIISGRRYDALELPVIIPGRLVVPEVLAGIDDLFRLVERLGIEALGGDSDDVGVA